MTTRPTPSAVERKVCNCGEGFIGAHHTSCPSFVKQPSNPTPNKMAERCAKEIVETLHGKPAIFNLTHHPESYLIQRNKIAEIILSTLNLQELCEVNERLENENLNLHLVLSGKETQEGYRGIANEVSRKLKTLQAQCDELKADKERLDWLEKHFYKNHFSVAKELTYLVSNLDKNCVRHAIDQARQREKV